MATYELYPDGTTSAGASWGPTGAATIHQAIDDLVGAADDDTTYAQGSAATWDDFICTLAPMVDVVEITSVTMLVRYNNAGGGSNQELDYGLRIGSTSYLNGPINVVSATYAESTKTWTTNPATSAPWTKPQLDDLSIVVRTQDQVPATDSVRVTQAYVSVEYQPIPAGIAAAREIGAHRLRRYRRPLVQPSIETGLDKLDLELMDDLSLTHFAWPNASGSGAGVANWKRALLQLREVDVNLNTRTLRLGMRGRRGFLCTFWDTAESRRSSSAAEDGVARLTTGGTLTYSRLSHAWHEDPGSRLVVQMGLNQKPIAYNGMLMENFASNYLQHSSCTEGATSVAGLTLSGTGVNGSSIASSTTTSIQPLFDATVSANAYLMTAGTPHAAALIATWPTTATINADTIVRISIDHKDSPTEVLQWRLVRGVDSFLWNDATEAWQAGAVSNDITTSTDRARFFSKVIDVGSNNTTLTFSLRMPSGGTSGRAHRIYHVQLEENAWATSHVVTTAATYARAIQTYSITNTLTKRAINATGGTFMCEFIPEWNSADMVAIAGFPAFFDMTYDSDNWIRLFWNSGTTTLDFQIRAAGVTYSATKSFTPVRGTTYKLAARWTSSAGELDMDARSLSVFVNGVKGTDATRAADPTETSVSLYIGGDSAGNAVNGNLRRILFSQEVYSDAEIARFAP